MNLSRRLFFRIGTGLLANSPVFAAQDRNSSVPQSRPAAESVMEMPFEICDPVRFGIIGVGTRGSLMLDLLLAITRARVTAVCDIVPEKTLRARDCIVRAGQPTPAVFAGGDEDFRNLVRREELDFVYIATPWDWHVPMALDSMKAGKHVGVEVPAASTIEDCWKLVDTSERTRRHCMIMENCCYGEIELLVLNMVRAGVFGELIYGEGAYLHDLRAELFGDEGEGLWRRFPHLKRNGNLYPTHGLGPVANYMGINRGDRFDYLVSMSYAHKGLEAYRAAHIARGSPKWKEKYRCGDVNTSLIKTAAGRTILLQHDVVNARPYSRLNMVQGVKGLFLDYPPRLYIEGDQTAEEFTDLARYRDQYIHPLWREHGEAARQSGSHGGMDYLMLWRLGPLESEEGHFDLSGSQTAQALPTTCPSNSAGGVELREGVPG
jgi:Oxidoreductase family, NAD-binding Rossmann fold